MDGLRQYSVFLNFRFHLNKGRLYDLNRILNITSRKNFDEAINCFSPDEVDYFYSEHASGSRGAGIYHISIGLKDEFSPQILAERLSGLVISKYEKSILKEILKHNYIEFLDSETDEILETAQNSLILFNQIYSRGIFVKNLTNIIENSDSISMDGFINFRTAEYRRIAHMVVSDAIEKLLVKEEYNEFIQMLQYYINHTEPQIDLIHIKPNSDGSFSFFNFKKERIIFEIEEINPIEIFVTNQDMLMSILISLIPKRIIWHNNPDCELQNIKLTLEQIFNDRFSVCYGCELCDNKR